MLILERQLDESIIIETPSGDTLEITLIETKRGKAKIGINAPEDHLIYREELIN